MNGVWGVKLLGDQVTGGRVVGELDIGVPSHRVGGVWRGLGFVVGAGG